jgi:hypothetical protein
MWLSISGIVADPQMGETGKVMAGPGARVPFRDAPRVAKEYGGKTSDWVKKTSTPHTARDGVRFETHWVENIFGWNCGVLAIRPMK